MKYISVLTPLFFVLSKKFTLIRDMRYLSCVEIVVESLKENPIEMKLKESNKSYEMITSRMETDNGYYFGIYNVMFGRRIRAGRYGEEWVELDWCCGDDPILLAKTYAFLKKHLERWDGIESPFNNLPGISDIKPFKHDEEFLNKVTAIIPEFKEIKYEPRDITF